jgi:hypothetical protein
VADAARPIHGVNIRFVNQSLTARIPARHAELVPNASADARDRDLAADILTTRGRHQIAPEGTADEGLSQAPPATGGHDCVNRSHLRQAARRLSRHQEEHSAEYNATDPDAAIGGR